MKISFVNRLMGIRRGGGEYFDYYIAKELQKLGYSVGFVVGKKMFNKSFLLKDFETVYISTPYLRDFSYKWGSHKSRMFRKLGSICLDIDLYLFEKRAFRYLKHLKNLENKPEIIQLCGLSRLGAWIREKLNIPTIIEWHGIPYMSNIKWAKRCSRHVGIGAAFPEVKKSISPSALQLTIGVDSEFFSRHSNSRVRELLGLSQATVVFVFVGRLIPVKNLFFMLNGFYEAINQNNKLHLLIVGDGTEREKLKDKILNKNLQTCVTLVGHKDREELTDYYSASDVFIITSNYESFSLVTLEAMACELPIIATNVGFLPEIVKDGENGSIVENNNVVQLKNAILNFAKSSSLRKEIGEKNRILVRNKYNWLKSAQKLISFYDEVSKNEDKSNK